MKIVVFDFDKTISEKDTFNSFLYFMGRNVNYYLIRRFVYYLVIALRKLRLISNLKQKQLGLNLFVNKNTIIDDISLISFCKNIKLRKFILDLLGKKSWDSRVIICSASPKIYIKKLFPKYEVYGLEFSLLNNKYIIKKHPYKIEKLRILQEIGVTRIDEFYTDSYSDRFIARISKINYVVSKTKTYCFDNYHSFENHFNRSKLKWLRSLF